MHMKKGSNASLFSSTWSGKRDSNARPQPWQGCALPTELFPRAAKYIGKSLGEQLFRLAMSLKSVTQRTQSHRENAENCKETWWGILGARVRRAKMRQSKV